MDGGVLSVPFDKLNDFYEKYIEAVNNKEKLYVVEQKTEYYNFFVDIDYKDETSLSIEEIKNICKIICDKVKRHGGKDCLISVSPPKNVNGLVKTGVHLNWPGFVVDQISALALREHILISLSKVKAKIDWNEIIDSAVYGCAIRKTKGSGFRMPWSHKMAKHMTCGGNGCEDCNNTGKITQVAYLPLFIYKHGPLSTLLKIDQKPNVEFLKMSSIRTDREQNVFIEPPSSIIKEGSFSVAQTKDELHNEVLKSMIEEFIQKNMEGQDDALVTKIFKNNNTYLVSTTSKYCENLKRCHSSNHVWFYISGNIIAQKCFCRCETIRERRDGFCKDFHGRRHQLSNKIIEQLYPKKEEIKNCPEIKKFEKKPQIKPNNVKPQLQSFIQKNMKCSENTNIVSISRQKNKFVVLTNSNYCEIIKNNHEEHAMSYIINNYEISQKCLLCKKGKPRTHVLPNNIVEGLYPKRKK